MLGAAIDTRLLLGSLLIYGTPALWQDVAGAGYQTRPWSSYYPLVNSDIDGYVQVC